MGEGFGAAENGRWEGGGRWEGIMTRLMVDFAARRGLYPFRLLCGFFWWWARWIWIKRKDLGTRSREVVIEQGKQHCLVIDARR